MAKTVPPPTGLGEDLVEAWDAAIASAVAAHGDWAVSNALRCGQYEDPAGVEYGGDRLQWSSRTLIETAGRWCARARHIAVRSEERRVGKESVLKCQCRWRQNNSKKK